MPNSRSASFLFRRLFARKCLEAHAVRFPPGNWPQSKGRLYSTSDEPKRYHEPSRSEIKKIKRRMKVWDKLRDAYDHTLEVYPYLRFGWSLVRHDIAKVYTVPAGRIASRKPLTKQDRREILFGIGQMIKVVPVGVLLMVPGGEVVLPLIVVVCPSLLPDAFSTVGKPTDEAIGLKIAAAVREMNKSIHTMTRETRRDDRIESLLHVTRGLTDLELFGSLTGLDLVDAVLCLEVDSFINACRMRDLNFLARLMNLKVQCYTRPQLCYLMYLKAHEIKIQDHNLHGHIEQEFISYKDEELVVMCAARGITCVGQTRAKMVKRLTRWLICSIEHKVPILTMFLTQVAHHDPSDTNAVLDEKSSDILHAFRLVLPWLRNKGMNPSDKRTSDLLVRIRRWLLSWIWPQTLPAPRTGLGPGSEGSSYF